jgi:RHH-type transcriptional regulator, rel operon repressor / antitoxin RelB
MAVSKNRKGQMPLSDQPPQTPRLRRRKTAGFDDLRRFWGNVNNQNQALAIHVSQCYARSMPISLRLPDDVEERLTALATLTGRSKTFYATQAIVEHIDDLEDAHLSAEIMARVRAGTEARVSLDALLADYDLAR